MKKIYSKEEKQIILKIFTQTKIFKNAKKLN